MEMLTILFVILALIIGGVIGIFWARSDEQQRAEGIVRTAAEQGRASAAVEIATLTERQRGLEMERDQLVQERGALKADLLSAQSDRTQLSERASRVPSLDEQVVSLLAQQSDDREKILSLSTTMAEKTQSLQDVLDRFSGLEEALAVSDRELVTTRKRAADALEESARLNAEIKAERDANLATQGQLKDEREQREAAQAQVKKVSNELADANQLRAIVETQAERIKPLEANLRETEQELMELRKACADLRESTGQLSAELKAEREVLTSVRSDFQGEKNGRDIAEARANRLTTELAEVRGQLFSEQSQSEEKLALLLAAKAELTDQFKSLANDILEEKAKRFTEQNQTNLGQLLDPLKTRLQEFQGKVEQVYVQEGKDRTALAEQVRQLLELNQSLSQDAKNLTSALKGSNKTQGNWGELILERVLESSGLRKGHEYDSQESHSREDGSRAQPDVVVHLPEDRHLIVDAKVSLSAYDSFSSAETDAERDLAVKRHLDSVRAHMKGLSEKNYQALYGLKSLDFVLMFIPIEPAFMVAITHDRDLFMEALNKNVLLVSPSTLLFVIRTVAHLWRQEAQSKNAQEIAKRGAELYDRLSAFVLDLEKVGDRLRQAQSSFDDARDKLSRNKGNVIRQAQMLKELGVKPTKSMPEALLEMSVEDTVDVDPIPLKRDFSMPVTQSD